MTRTLAATTAALLALTLAACSGDDEGSPGGDDSTPTEVLELAKTTLDETSGVQITLEADNLSSSVTGIRKATGVGVHPPAFEGSFDLSVNGIPATAEVIAVDGKVYAKNSLLLPQWTAIDPAQYGAPDPNQLMGEDAGFSSLLTATTDVEQGERVRGGEGNDEIFTSYTGTVPGDVVANIVPSAAGDFDASYTISEDGELREARLTGVFYEGDDDMTYTMTFDDYGTEKDIVAP
ncbi:LppX_LprAFG lipoprotein [Nocardioides lianchengensis]|uniref:Lipoprotein LprG n=1 Tax=Nocardioides lianchengensis TaxID=1045774 RepID=A0A1G6R551_9ACTN|nr:LppX_LprAFG lipoprotein [Nocardioides lianchengensis]NYG10383.1 lipoprotein LprG [Nocardioides lianchengensis]SDC99127.1 lipoprotein LprG [Nocardioides lianchengensis]